MKTVSIFLPAKKGSQRVINKNTRPFHNFKNGLIELKIYQILRCKFVEEIVLSTNDPNIIELAEIFRRIKIDYRPEELCLDSTKAEDIMKHAGKVCVGDNIMLVHCTSPFTTTEDYDRAIETYFEKEKLGYDSLVGVLPFRNFMLDKAGKMLNNDQSKGWPRTQDLDPWYEVNHSIFIAPKHIYVDRGDKVGDSPFLFEMSKIKSIDIDWDEDFLLAEAMCEKLKLGV